MTNVALRRTHPEATYEAATVAAVDETEITVRVGRGQRCAARAASCLVAPSAGDEVALFTTGDGRTFVIAILVRADATPTEIAVAGDLRISANGGSCQIVATDGVDLRTEGTMSLASGVLNLRAVEGSVVMSKLKLLASSVLAHSDGVRVAATTFESFCDRLSQTAKRCFRRVEELDHLRAERMDYRTESEMSLRSENFLVGARKLVKVDGEQIHVG